MDTIWGEKVTDWLQEFDKKETRITINTNEPQHDKTNKLACVWLESSQCTQWVGKDPRFLHADSENSDQADLSLRWADNHFVGFVILRLKWTRTQQILQSNIRVHPAKTDQPGPAYSLVSHHCQHQEA